jgi:hypothetical protein
VNPNRPLSDVSSSDKLTIVKIKGTVNVRYT